MEADMHGSPIDVAAVRQAFEMCGITDQLPLPQPVADEAMVRDVGDIEAAAHERTTI